MLSLAYPGAMVLTAAQPLVRPARRTLQDLQLSNDERGRGAAPRTSAPATIVCKVSRRCHATSAALRQIHAVTTYLTMYCGKHHRLSDGAPVDHSCRVLDPEYLQAERHHHYERAVAILQRMPIDLHRGVRRQDHPEDTRRVRALRRTLGG